jgi:hypothetical protein
MLNNLLPSYYNEFYDERVRMLKIFLNYINNDVDLKNSKEFIKFINDPEFDQIYFDREENFFYYPEANKFSDSYTNKFLGMFISKDQNVPFSSNDNRIKTIKEHFSNLIEKLKIVKNAFVKLTLTQHDYVKSIIDSSKNFSEIKDNFFYMKDIGFQNEKTRKNLSKYSDLCNDLALIYKEEYNRAIMVDDKFEVK